MVPRLIDYALDFAIFLSLNKISEPGAGGLAPSSPTASARGNFRLSSFSLIFGFAYLRCGTTKNRRGFRLIHCSVCIQSMAVFGSKCYSTIRLTPLLKNVIVHPLFRGKQLHSLQYSTLHYKYESSPPHHHLPNHSIIKKMSPPKILFVLTSHSKMGALDRKTGWYLVRTSCWPLTLPAMADFSLSQPELAHPYAVLAPHAQLTIASPAGGASPLDPASVEGSKEDTACMDFLNSNEKLWTTTEKLSSFVGRAREFDAIFYVGGHGRMLQSPSTSSCPPSPPRNMHMYEERWRTFLPDRERRANVGATAMWDLAHDATSHQIINEFASAGKVVAAVCHGPAALAYVKRPSGEYLLQDHAVTGFSTSEEEAVGLTQAMPFLLEDQLNVASGGKYQAAGSDWAPNVVVSGNIITGQNPASAAGVGEAILKAVQ